MEWTAIHVILFLRFLTRDENYKGKKYCIGLKDAKDLVDFFKKYHTKRHSGLIDEETYQHLMDEMGQRFCEAMSNASDRSLEDEYIKW